VPELRERCGLLHQQSGGEVPVLQATLLLRLHEDDSHERVPTLQVGLRGHLPRRWVQASYQLKLREEGLLPYRNAAPPICTRPVSRFLLEAVLKLRTDYQTEKPNQPMRTETQRRRVKGASGYKHLKLGDD
jgi:hypothetical protein